MIRLSVHLRVKDLPTLSMFRFIIVRLLALYIRIRALTILTKSPPHVCIPVLSALCPFVQRPGMPTRVEIRTFQKRLKCKTSYVMQLRSFLLCFIAASYQGYIFLRERSSRGGHQKNIRYAADTYTNKP